MKTNTLRNATALVFVWYFLISWSTGYSSFTQVGPFKNESDCKSHKDDDNHAKLQRFLIRICENV
jgi:hypothetical protein